METPASRRELGAASDLAQDMLPEPGVWRLVSYPDGVVQWEHAARTIPVSPRDPEHPDSPFSNRYLA